MRAKQPTITITKTLAADLLDTVIGRVRWYVRRACEVPDHLWEQFAILCYDLGEDPHAIIRAEMKSSRQVWHA